MKKVFIILNLNLFIFFNANAADQITKILKANHGKAVGHTTLDGRLCRIQVYRPGEFTSTDDSFYIEYTFDNTPAYNVVTYPNNGMVSEWILDEQNSMLVVYVTDDKKDYAQFSYDPKTLKIQSFGLPQNSCENLK